MTRLARRADGTPLVGDGEGFVPLSATDSPAGTWAAALRAATEGQLTATGATAPPVPAERISFGSPLPDPGTLWGIGLNYADHAGDLDETPPDEPASFIKATGTAVGPGGPIRLPPRDLSARVTAEGELALVVGRTAHEVDAANAEDVIAGYLPVIDVTAEDVLERNPRFLTRAKSFDTFLVLGPWLVTPDEIADLDGVTVRTVHNGAVAASNEVRAMHFSPAELLAFHSRVATLERGDLLSTGTPGAAMIEAGDSVTAAVTGVGSVSATVDRR